MIPKGTFFSIFARQNGKVEVSDFLLFACVCFQKQSSMGFPLFPKTPKRAPHQPIPLQASTLNARNSVTSQKQVMFDGKIIIYIK